MVCGKKQSVRKVCAISHSAKDVREVVQKLNKDRLERSERGGERMEEIETGVEEEPTTSEGKNAPSQQEYWNAFLEPMEDQVHEGMDGEDDDRYVTELPDRSLKRKRGEAMKNRKEMRQQDARNSHHPLEQQERTESPQLCTSNWEAGKVNPLQGRKGEVRLPATKPKPAVAGAWAEFLGDGDEQF